MNSRMLVLALVMGRVPIRFPFQVDTACPSRRVWSLTEMSDFLMAPWPRTMLAVRARPAKRVLSFMFG